MFSAPNFEMRLPPEGINKQFTVHDYNRNIQPPHFQDVKGYPISQRKASNNSRRKFNQSPPFGDTKFHNTDGTNTEQLTDLQNPLENLTQTQENDDLGPLIKKISSVRGSIARTGNSVTRIERTSNERRRAGDRESTPRGSRESIFRNQMMSNQGQG